MCWVISLSRQFGKKALKNTSFPTDAEYTAHFLHLEKTKSSSGLKIHSLNTIYWHHQGFGEADGAQAMVLTPNKTLEGGLREGVEGV